MELSPWWLGDDGVDNLPDDECIWASRRSIGTLRVWAAARAPDDNVDAFDWIWKLIKKKKNYETEFIIFLNVLHFSMHTEDIILTKMV